ncbi:hypothetical protein BJX65DRAFT_287968, partial [Aspergillus insuetus]
MIIPTNTTSYPGAIYILQAKRQEKRTAEKRRRECTYIYADRLEARVCFVWVVYLAKIAWLVRFAFVGKRPQHPRANGYQYTPLTPIRLDSEISRVMI